MTLWIDADACPAPIREILYRAARRHRLSLTLVANRALQIPKSPHIRLIRVPAGADAADDHIVQAIQPGELLISADIPLAARVIDKGAQVITPRGELLDADNIGPRRSLRDFMHRLRNDGIPTPGAAPLGPRDHKRFADALDRWLAHNAK